MPTFASFIASLPRHQKLAEIDAQLALLAENGATGIWIENDYLRWSWTNEDGDSGFDGNWRLFNIFDFTRSVHAPQYKEYLHELIARAARYGLGVYGSFWLPKLNRELTAWLQKHRPNALGRAIYGPGNECVSWCSCAAGGGISLLKEILDEYLTEFPKLAGLKISIRDNSAFVCTHHCPNAHGDTEASNAARVYHTVEQAVADAGHPPEFLCIYPWFWDHVPGMEESIVAALTPGYRVVTKYALELPVSIEPDRPPSDYIDATLVADRPGRSFQRSCKLVGGARLLDMTPHGNSMDLMFVAWPPLLALAWERWTMLAGYETGGLLDFDCSGSVAPGTLAGFSLFQERPELRTDVAVSEVIRRTLDLELATVRFLAQAYADFAAGWKCIPLGLSEETFSQRFGQAWPMALATPLVREAFAGADQKHRIHWFSSYNFFRKDTASRLRSHFERMSELWSGAEPAFAAASAQDPKIAQEWAAIRACVYCAESALIWCDAAEASGDPAAFQICVERFIPIVDSMRELCVRFPELWANNCWHPHQTAISQRHLGFRKEDRNAFVASLSIMRGERV